LIAAATDYLDEIERALTTYVNLPELVDLQLRPEGITLHTNDFPRLICESTGLDLRQYFIDCFKDADFLRPDEKDKLAFDLFHCFNTVTSFVSGPDGARMERSEVTQVELPAAMSQGFVQKMTVDKVVSFQLDAKLPDEVTFAKLSGITFNVGRKLIGTSQIHLKAKGSMCIVTPVLAERGPLRLKTTVMDGIKSLGKDLVVSALLRLGKLSTELPIVRDEFRQYLLDAVNFRTLLQDREKDLVMFIERSAGIKVEDPLTRSLLTKGMHIIKRDEQIELIRDEMNVCDLGGVALEISPTINLHLEKNTRELIIDHLSGIGVEVPFEPPPELQAIGLDVHKTLPKTIISLNLGERNQDEQRRLVVRTAPACWMALDLNAQMQPATDALGNWIIVGVANNPISGAPQKFFVRLDKDNNLNMTTDEITEVVTQTAVEGFDFSDPFTWTWGAVALGGHALLAASEIMRSVAGDREEVKKSARKLGRLIGRFLTEL
jgi:hypothetical protein